MRAREKGSAAPQPTLGVLDAVSIIVGIVIGAGIFETPALVAANAGDSRLLLLAWVAGGVATLIGGLCFAELATTYPHPGGNYHYLVRAFGAAPGFLYVWARLAVIQTGSIAMLGFIFGDYASEVLPLGPYSSSIYAAAAIALLTAVNVAGIVQGKGTQHVLTLLTLAGMAVLIAVGLSLAPAAPAAPAAAPATGSPSAAFGLVMIFVLLSYGGWSEAAFISAELKNVRRNMALALLGSIAVITAIYLLLNYALLRGLGLQEMAGSNAVAAELMRRSLGAPGVLFIGAIVAVTALDSMNASIITGGRTNYALGRDYGAFRWLGYWSERGTPVNALLAQGLVALALVLLGTVTRNGFRTMVEFTTPVFWLFLLLTAVSLLVLRRREPHVERPFRVPLYPLTPLAFAAISGYMLYSSLAYTGLGALVGVAVLAAGVPLLYALRRPPAAAVVVPSTVSDEGEAA